MQSLVRGVLAVVAGLIAGVIVVGGIEAISTHIYPPPGFDPHDPAALTAVAADLPLGAFVGVLLAWGAGALAGAWTAAKIGGRAGLGYLIGMLLGAGERIGFLRNCDRLFRRAGRACVV